MRVIAGVFGGRRLTSPRTGATRPTSDRVREALFSSLGSVAGFQVLDLYSGSGAVAVEAISRGASGAVLVESASQALAALRANLRDLAIEDRCRVLAMPVQRASGAIVAAGPYQLIYADPPYRDVSSGRLAKVLNSMMADGRALAPDVQLVVEHAARDESPQLLNMQLARCRRYGDTVLSYYGLVTCELAADTGLVPD